MYESGWCLHLHESIHWIHQFGFCLISRSQYSYERCMLLHFSNPGWNTVLIMLLDDWTALLFQFYRQATVAHVDYCLAPQKPNLNFGDYSESFKLETIIKSQVGIHIITLSFHLWSLKDRSTYLKLSTFTHHYTNRFLALHTVLSEPMSRSYHWDGLIALDNTAKYSHLYG